MRTTTAEFIKNYGRFADTALGEPVIITKNGHDRLVMMSVDEYDRLKNQEKNSAIVSTPPVMSGKERARLVVEWAESHHDTPTLSEEAMSRASMYSDR